MSPGARMEYREAVYLRYKRASRKEKTIILEVKERKRCEMIAFMRAWSDSAKDSLHKDWT